MESRCIPPPPIKMASFQCHFARPYFLTKTLSVVHSNRAEKWFGWIPPRHPTTSRSWAPIRGLTICFLIFPCHGPSLHTVFSYSFVQVLLLEILNPNLRFLIKTSQHLCSVWNSLRLVFSCYSFIFISVLDKKISDTCICEIKRHVTNK